MRQECCKKNESERAVFRERGGGESCGVLMRALPNFLTYFAAFFTQWSEETSEHSPVRLTLRALYT